MHNRDKTTARSEWFFEALLKLLGCDNIRIVRTNVGKEKHILFGFSAKDNAFPMISHFFNLHRAYGEGDQFVVSLTAQRLREDFIDYFDTILRGILETWKYPANTIQSGGWGQGEYPLTEENYKTLHSSQCQGEWYQLIESGLVAEASRETDDQQARLLGYSHPFPPNIWSLYRDVYKITVNDIGLLAKKSFDLKKMPFSLEQKTAFMMGADDKLGAKSDVKTSFFGNRLFDKRLVKEIFDLVSPTTPSRSFCPTLFVKAPEVAKKDEKNDIKQNVMAIEKLIADLNSEVNSVLPYPNKNRKAKTAEFLQLILVFAAVNPRFSLPTCVECAMRENDELYQVAKTEARFSAMITTMMPAKKAGGAGPVPLAKVG